MPDLLYEIGTEEMPAGYLEPALDQLAEELRRRLADARLEPARMLTAGTPRRMAVCAQGLPEHQPPLRSTVTGPPAKAAFDAQGRPTAAAAGFARSRGVSVESLKVEETPRGPYVVAVVEQPGRYTADVLPALLAEATAALGFPKSMRWEPSGFQFARPIRSLVALLDDAVLPLEIAGVRADRMTAGHPFLAPVAIELKGASWDLYLEALRDHCVVADVAERREIVRREINALLAQHGAELDDEELLEEVTNLVEWPHAVEGAFDAHFLDVPAPVLIAAMKEHQRYFPVRDAGGRLGRQGDLFEPKGGHPAKYPSSQGLAPHFVTVSNRTAEQDELVREGNERVLLARLDDAKFFWDQDRSRRLEDLAPRLEGVTFLAGLGNNLQRTERLAELGARIAERMGADPAVVRRAARLCKADLLTGLVGEFPSLQGTVGRELALVQGEPATVADAIAEHYLPAGRAARSGGDDALPASPTGACLALADKLDVIAGCFSLGLLPSGSQDPYALRRNAFGILLIIERKGLDLRLGELVDMACEVARSHGIRCEAETGEKVLEFFRDRLYNMALERGCRHDFVRAVLASGAGDVGGFWARLEALAACAAKPWWPQLVELVDRTYRIQRDVEPVPVREDLLKEQPERDLYDALGANREHVEALFHAGDYMAAAEAYTASLAQLVHDYFEKVFVNVDDQPLQLNRKSLLGEVYHLFADHFADLYLIEVAAVS
jgi:glycyl-tRNA synthetase beta chain